LQAARARAAGGQRVVGLLGADIPVELVTASGAFALQLPFSAGAATSDADRYVEATFSPGSRGVAQQWLRGEYDFIDSVILSRSDDSSQRLYYYLSELQRRGIAGGPQVLLYDLAKIPRPTSEAHSVQSTRRLAARLGVDPGGLPAAIVARNRRRRLLLAVEALRQSAAPPSGPEVERLLRASDVCEPESFDAALDGWLRSRHAPWAGPRLLLAGSAPPDERWHVVVEQAGARIVAELGDHSVGRLGEPIPATADPLHTLAMHHHRLPYGPRSFVDRAGEVTAQAARCGADGVILWMIEEDESMVWSVPDIIAGLETAGVPLLSLTRRRWNGGEETADLIRSFLGTLRVRA
jgi:hypothetical protein